MDGREYKHTHYKAKWSHIEGKNNNQQKLFQLKFTLNRIHTIRDFWAVHGHLSQYLNSYL